MVSLIGSHYTKNGIKQFPARVILSLNGNGLGDGEQHADTITILRDTRVFPDGETAPDFNSYDGSDWDAYGRYWYQVRTEDGGNFKAAWALNQADYYQIQNEQGGNDAWALQRCVDIERAISRAASLDGVKCCIMNLAGGTPGDFELWKQIIAPFIVEAWEEGGHIYGRHVYGGDLVDGLGSPLFGQPMRIFDEMAYLSELGYGGGVAITELGLDAGYNVPSWERFKFQVENYEAALRPWQETFIGFCWWECGDTEFKADYTHYLKQMTPYMENEAALPKWTPITEEPPMSDIEERVEDLEDLTNVLRHLAIAQGVTIDDLENRVSQLEGTPPIDPPPSPLLTIAPNAIGTDTSAHQGYFQWAFANSRGIEYGIIRSSNGLGSASTDEFGRDKQLYNNADQLTAIPHMPWAIYHYLRPDQGILDQVDLVHRILAELKGRETYPRTATLADGTRLPTLYIDVEEGNLTPNQIRAFYDGMITTGLHVGIYTSKSIWDSIMSDTAVWWANVSCWVAAYGSNSGYPPPWVPWIPNGFNVNVLWQYTSVGGHIIDSTAGLDLNMATPFEQGVEPPPIEPPPESFEYSNIFMRAEPGIWRVIKRGDGSGEDVWELNLSTDTDVRVKNEKQGEWYEYRNTGIWRIRDTSPAPDSHGNDRLYLQHTNGLPGGQIAPDTIEKGRTYTYYSDVQFKAKQGCANLEENSNTNAPSTFLLKDVIKDYTFSTGMTVDWLYVTEQTGEIQLYAMKDDRRLGWVGGGASQDNNVWSAELNEVYFDRDIPQNEPNTYC